MSGRADPGRVEARPGHFARCASGFTVPKTLVWPSVELSYVAGRFPIGAPWAAPVEANGAWLDLDPCLLPETNLSVSCFLSSLFLPCTCLPID